MAACPVVKASSNLDARFKGDRFDIGLDAMIDVSSVLLSGCTLPDIGTCTVTRAEAVYADGWADDATVLAQIDFDVRFTSPLSAFQIKTADDLKSLGITGSRMMRKNLSSPTPSTPRKAMLEKS
ncbi:hypothetical protein HGG75_05030 [Ochrobactrum pseudogrignonense]|nr:hypothetical protein [Brucella pseudogrignonensis]